MAVKADLSRGTGKVSRRSIKSEKMLNRVGLNWNEISSMYEWNNWHDYIVRYNSSNNDLIYRLCLGGCNDIELAFLLKVSMQSINHWVINEPEFTNTVLRAMIDYPDHKRKIDDKSMARKKWKKSQKNRLTSNAYIKNKLKTDVKFRLKFNMSSLIRQRLKKKTKDGTFRHTGYTVQQLWDHLESRFVDGMSWNNYGKVWHIDHIKPDRLFDYKSVDDQEFKDCWALSNLQPLFAIDNLRKGGKYAS